MNLNEDDVKNVVLKLKVSLGDDFSKVYSVGISPHHSGDRLKLRFTDKSAVTRAMKEVRGLGYRDTEISILRSSALR